MRNNRYINFLKSFPDNQAIEQEADGELANNNLEITPVKISETDMREEQRRVPLPSVVKAKLEVIESLLKYKEVTALSQESNNEHGQDTKNIKDPEIIGSEDFILITRQAVELLNSVPEFAVVKRYLGAIKESDRSGMNVWMTVPTFMVSNKLTKSPLPRYASDIAHDAYHSYLYQTAKSEAGGGKSLKLKLMQGRMRRKFV